MQTSQTQTDSSQTVSLPLLTYFKDKTAIPKQKLKPGNIYIYNVFWIIRFWNIIFLCILLL